MLIGGGLGRLRGSAEKIATGAAGRPGAIRQDGGRRSRVGGGLEYECENENENESENGCKREYEYEYEYENENENENEGRGEHENGGHAPAGGDADG
jgi:hypothetical protein